MSKIKDTIVKAAKQKRTWAGIAILAVLVGKPEIAAKVTNLGEAAILILGGTTPEQGPDGLFSAPVAPS